MDEQTLPDFIKDRMVDMDDHTKQCFLNMITPEWLEVQMACYEMMKGVEDGRWTVEEIQQEMQKHKESLNKEA